MKLYTVKNKSFTSLYRLCKDYDLNYYHVYRKIKKDGYFDNNKIYISISTLIKRDVIIPN